MFLEFLTGIFYIEIEMATVIRSGHTVARNATKLRRATGMSRNAFAKAVGISSYTMGLIEGKYDAKERYTPALSTVIKLATAAGVSVEDFISASLAIEA